MSFLRRLSSQEQDVEIEIELEPREPEPEPEPEVEPEPQKYQWKTTVYFAGDSSTWSFGDEDEMKAFVEELTEDRYNDYGWWHSENGNAIKKSQITHILTNKREI